MIHYILAEIAVVWYKKCTAYQSSLLAIYAEREGLVIPTPK
jgi:hypothetical protein